VLKKTVNKKNGGIATNALNLYSLFIILTKWVLIPLMSSLTESLVVAVMPVSSKISRPMLASAIPSKNFYFFELLVAGKLVVKKFFIAGVTLFWEMAIIFSRASSAVLNE